MNKRITHKQALTLIDRHGFKPFDCTVSHPDTDLFAYAKPHTESVGTYCEAFYACEGERKTYALKDVMNWLGY